MKVSPEMVGSSSKDTKIDTYTGNFKDNMLCGKGVFTWHDGRVYDGEFLDDKRHGYGLMRYPDGEMYEGLWAKGKKHGDGTLITATGAKRMGRFENNELSKPLGSYTVAK